MRILKSIFFIIMFSLLFTTLINIVADSSYNHIDNINVMEEETITYGVDYKYYQMDTNFLESAAKQTRNVYTYTIQQSEYAHLATWTYSDKDNYTKRTLMDIAYDYERNHPGWIVLGGINAEGYYNGELTNAFIQDGDVIRKDVSAESFKKLIGFKDDGSVVIKQVPIASSNPLLKIDDLSYDVTKVNELPADNDISVFTKDLKTSINLTGYHVVEATYSLFRTSKEFPDPNKTHSGSFFGIFIKGTVNDQVALTTISDSDFENRQFYIVTKNEEVISHLTKGKTIKIEFDYVDEFSDVTSMTGYMYRYLKDGITIPVDYKETNEVGQIIDYNCDYYKSTSKERAGIGFKADGSIVLLTANTGRMGPTQFEVGEMFRILGCKDAYQFDGGGSVTFVKRNEFGQINMLNTPGDGTPRSIMSGLFIVAPDPLLQTYPSEQQTSKIIFHLKDISYKEQISDLTITYNDKTYPLIDEKIVVDQLNENTEYTFEVSYTLNQEQCKATIKGKTKAYTPPSDPIKIGKITDSSIEVIKNDIKEISNMIIYLGKTAYPLNDNTYLILTNLNKDTEYEIYATYDIYDAELNKTFNITSELIRVKTASFKIPEIESFEETIKSKTLIGIKYKYLDPDDKVISAYILYGEEKFIINSKLGTATITNLDFENKSYSFQLILEYLDEDGNVQKIESDNLSYIIEVEEPTPEKKKCGNKCAEIIISSICLSTILALLLKKQK